MNSPDLRGLQGIYDDVDKSNSINDQSGAYLQINLESHLQIRQKTLPNKDLMFKELGEFHINLNYRHFVKKYNLKIRTTNLKVKKTLLIFMIFYITVYFFMLLAFFIANAQNSENIEKFFGLGIHRLDFWGTFVFSFVEMMSLNTASSLVLGSLTLYLCLLNLGTSLVAVLLYTLNFEYWESISHFFEYTAQLGLTFINFAFIMHQFKIDNILNRYRLSGIVIIIFLLICSVLKIIIYKETVTLSNQSGHDAFYFEFLGEMANALFAFLFTYILYIECSEDLQKISNFKTLCIISRVN